MNEYEAVILPKSMVEALTARIAALEARCLALEQEYAEYRACEKPEAEAAEKRIAQLEAALRWSRDGFVIHCPKATAYIARIDSALETKVK